MDSDTPVLKWTAAIIGVVVACFSLGYFFLGPKAGGPSNGVQVTEETANSVRAAMRSTPSPTPSASGVIVQERTEEIEAKRRRQEEEAKKKEEEEAKKKAAEEERKKAEEEAKLLAQTATPTPAPSPSPDASAAPDNGTPDGITTVPSPAEASEGGSGGARTESAPPAEASVPKPSPTKAPAAALYRVRVGTFPTRDAAKNLAAELTGRGYATAVVTEGSGDRATYRVQVGAFRNQKKAQDTQAELKANGYDSTVE
jgi:cell division protein FtsN